MSIWHPEMVGVLSLRLGNSIRIIVSSATFGLLSPKAESKNGDDNDRQWTAF